MEMDLFQVLEMKTMTVVSVCISLTVAVQLYLLSKTQHQVEVFSPDSPKCQSMRTRDWLKNQHKVEDGVSTLHHFKVSSNT